MNEKIPSKTLRELVQNLEVKIKATCEANLKCCQDNADPVEEWIPEDQMSHTKVITLRTAEETRKGSVMKLRQFNPSVFLVQPNGILCRVPGCEVRKPQLKPTSSSERIKQDLFLCKNHRTKMASLVSQRCEKESGPVSPARDKHEDFNGYTYLIGKLENAFMYLIKKPATLNVPSQLFANRDLQLAEVFLNARNFLIITNALLNPNGHNIFFVLRPFLVMLNRILDHLLDDPDLLQRDVTALRDIMDIILNFFGIIYSWVFLVNPGAQVGAGAGLILGGVAAALFAFPPVGIVASVVIGLIGGRLIGGGGYEWYQQQHEVDRQNQRQREYIQFVREQFGQAPDRLPRYHVPANPAGDVELVAVDGPLD